MAGAAKAAPRFNTTRLSPSRKSTVFRSLAAITLTICWRKSTSIGPRETSGEDFSAGFFGDFFRLDLSFKMAALKSLVQAGIHFAGGVRNQHVILGSDTAYTGNVNSDLNPHHQ